MMAARGPEDSALIANYVHECLAGFQKACESLVKADVTIKRKIPPWNINDELGRFRLWCGNIAAHRKGQSSLDYKLREASHIRERLIELLKNLDTVIREATEIICGVRVPWEDLSDSDSEFLDDDLPLEESETTELQQLVSNMAEIITCLMRLSMAIRNPAPHDQFKESTQIDTSHYERYDIGHVRGKFPHAEEYLISRLGKAISRRRQYLCYRDEHRKKLEQGLERPEVIVAPSERIQSTVASSIPEAMKTSSSAANLDEGDYCEDTLSQTSYASSTNDPTRLRPPPLPEQGQDGEPFECTLCFRFTSVRQVSAWHKHVYRDLQPYVCSFRDCGIPDCTYESRHDWFKHELQSHRKWWECIDGCNRPFQSYTGILEHLQDAHPDWSDKGRLDDLIRTCERQASMDTEVQCALCQQKLASLTQLRRHLGKHHEELALFALPPYMKDDRDESDGDQDGNESRSFPSSVSVGRAEILDGRHDEDQALEGVEKALGREHPETLASARSLGLVLESQGKDEEVELMHWRALEGRKNVLGDEHPDTLASMADLTSTYKDQGRLKERGLGFLKNPVASLSRPMNSEESWAAYDFELHAQKCANCRDPYEVHRSHEQLCEIGHRLAQEVAVYLYNRADGETYSTVEKDHKLVHVEIPATYIQVRGLLKAVERSLRYRSRTPFVSIDRDLTLSNRGKHAEAEEIHRETLALREKVLLSFSEAETSSKPKATHAIFLRKLPSSSDRDGVRNILLFAKDLVACELVSASKHHPEDKRFASAIALFSSLEGAKEARDLLNGKRNASNDANLIVEMVQENLPGAIDSRRNTVDSTSARRGSVSAATGITGTMANGRQSSRYNRTFQTMEKVSSPNGTPGLGNGEFPVQNLFSPTSPVNTSFTHRNLGKSVIHDEADDDDGPFKESIGYATGGPRVSAMLPRGTTNQPSIPATRFSHSAATMQSPGTDLSAMSPHFITSAMDNSGPNASHQQHMQHFSRPNFPPVNPADKNPPCNTLYVGNLPIDTSEDELKALFSKQRGYKRLCFRTKQNGPMCFVEFEDVSFATKAWNELHGHPLHNSVKGGIRLSFSKNPLGVRAGQSTSIEPASAIPPTTAMPGFGDNVTALPDFTTASLEWV